MSQLPNPRTSRLSVPHIVFANKHLISGRFVFYDIIIVVVAIITIMTSIKLRRKFLKLSNQKLSLDKSWENWSLISDSTAFSEVFSGITSRSTEPAVRSVDTYYSSSSSLFISLIWSQCWLDLPIQALSRRLRRSMRLTLDYWYEYFIIRQQHVVKIKVNCLLPAWYEESEGKEFILREVRLIQKTSFLTVPGRTLQSLSLPSTLPDALRLTLEKHVVLRINHQSEMKWMGRICNTNYY